MTCVVVFSNNVWWLAWSLAYVAYDLCGCLLNQCFNDLCSQRLMWLSFQSTLYNLCGQWFVCLMTYVVNDLCGHHLTLCTLGRVGRLIDYEKQEGYFLHRFSSLVPSGLGGFSPIELLFFSKAISLIDVALPMARPTVKPTEPLKRKRGRPTGRTKKRAKWGDKEDVTRRNPSQCASSARNRQVAGDLSPWWSAGEPAWW